MWCPRWHNLDAKPSGRLEEFRTSFSSARTLNMSRIGLIRWIMNLSTIISCKVVSLHYIFSSRTLKPKLGPHHYTCNKINPQKVDKVEFDWGLNCTWNGARAQVDPKPCLKWALKHPYHLTPTPTNFVSNVAETWEFSSPLCDHHLWSQYGPSTSYTILNLTP
jgi:hypothetical protein